MTPHPYSCLQVGESGAKWGEVVFRGTHQHNMDGKGRLSVPARFREWLEKNCGGQLIVTFGFDGCLNAYPLPYWEEVEQKLSQVPNFSDKRVRKVQRLIVGNSEELNLDNQGRVLLSPSLRQYAKLEKEVTIVGQIKKFEIWSRAMWQQNEEESLATLSEDVAHLAENLGVNLVL